MGEMEGELKAVRAEACKIREGHEEKRWMEIADCGSWLLVGLTGGFVNDGFVLVCSYSVGECDFIDFPSIQTSLFSSFPFFSEYIS